MYSQEYKRRLDEGNFVTDDLILMSESIGNKERKGFEIERGV